MLNYPDEIRERLVAISPGATSSSAATPSTTTASSGVQSFRGQRRHLLRQPVRRASAGINGFLDRPPVAGQGRRAATRSAASIDFFEALHQAADDAGQGHQRPAARQQPVQVSRPLSGRSQGLVSSAAEKPDADAGQALRQRSAAGALPPRKAEGRQDVVRPRRADPVSGSEPLRVHLRSLPEGSGHAARAVLGSGSRCRWPISTGTRSFTQIAALADKRIVLLLRSVRAALPGRGGSAGQDQGARRC